MKQIASIYKKPAKFLAIFLAVIIALLLCDNMVFASEAADPEPKYVLDNPLVAPEFEAPEFVLSKSVKMELPNLTLADDLTLTESDLDAEQKLIKARSSSGGGGSKGGGYTAPSGPLPSGGSGQANLASWRSINSDTAAFLRIPGTNINYPVMNSNYYAYRNEYGGSGSKPGCVWAYIGGGGLSSKASMNRNTVITGHNWGNCRGGYPMIGYSTSAGKFDQLLSYTSPSFAASNPYITLSLPSGEDVTLAVVGAFYTQNIHGYDSRFIQSSDAYSIATDAAARSVCGSYASVSSSDKIVTFFTCTRYYAGIGGSQRFILVTKVL